MFEKLDKKYLISELIDEGDFVDSRIFYDMLRRANKSMSDEVADIKLKTREYAEYLETWVHEIKTPIASARLTIENNRGSVAKSIGGDIDRIEGYVQNVLFYTRSSFVEKDYMIKELSLDALVKRALKENSRMLIENNTAVSMDGLDINVFTDEKWICFILGQIITNSVKYSRGDNPRLCFYGRDIGQSVVLDISDDGIGIPAADLPRIFEKGFTGENGRKYAKSTGMGLFLCKKLCGSLGIGISAGSGEMTTVSLTFPKTDMFFR
jgi:signal transduction histidine kinase